MKKILMLLACGLTIGATACDSFPKQEEMPPNENQAVPSEDMAAMTSMAAPIHALAETMLRTDSTYLPHDPGFFWNSLYFFLENYGCRHEAVELSDEGIISIPRKAMQEHAIALFSDYESLPELPESLSSRVAYLDSQDIFLVYPEDYAPYTLAMADISEKDGVYCLLASLSGVEGEPVGTWEVTLVKNTYADGLESLLYPYSISSMRAIHTQAEQAIFNGLADSHTAEVILNDGSIAAFQFDTDSEVGQALRELEVGAGFSLEYRVDEIIGTYWITAIQ